MRVAENATQAPPGGAAPRRYAGAPPAAVPALFLAMALWGLFAGAAFSAEKKWMVGFPEDNMANDWRAAQVRELAREFSKYPNVRFLTSDAGGNVTRNVQQIEAMVRQGADLLFLGPRDARLMSVVAKRVRSQGVRIILLTRRIESDDFDTYISPNDFKIAQQAADYLARHLGGKGRILMIEGVPTTTTAKQRSAGFRKGLEASPGVRLVATKTGHYSRAGGIRAMEAAIREGGRFDAVFSHNDAMAAGARMALRAAGIDPRTVPMVGIDYIREARDAIRKGEQLASFTYPTCGKEGARAAMQILKGTAVPRRIDVPARIVTMENVEQVEPIF